MDAPIGRSVRTVYIADMEFTVGSGIDLYDHECWKSWICDVWGNLIEVADGATREDAEANVIELHTSALEAVLHA